MRVHVLARRSAFDIGKNAMPPLTIAPQEHKRLAIETARLNGEANITDEEIIELAQVCAETDGVGRLVRFLRMTSWATRIQPRLRSDNLSGATE